MSSTNTSNLGLFKATPGSAEPFRTSDVNSNWDKVDAAIGLPYSDFTQGSANNTASEISVFSQAIGPALQGSIWKCGLYGVYAHSATSTTLTYRIKIGSVLMATWQITTPASALSARGWNADIMVMCTTTGGSGLWKVAGNACMVINTTHTLNVIDGGGTKDTTIAQNFELTLQWGAANAANIASLDAGYIKRFSNG